MIATLLHYANTNPPLLQREQFYVLKDRLLERYARPDGEDVQHIVDPCWGYFGDDSCEGTTCKRCGGTGVYRETFVLLRRYRWGRYVFHRPVERSAVSCFGRWPTIKGRVQHARYGFAALEARLWLYLLCGEWRLLLHALRSSSADGPYPGGRYWWPLLNVQRVVFWIAIYTKRRHCFNCDRRFWTRGDGWTICRRCRREKYGAVDLPF